MASHAQNIPLLEKNPKGIGPMKPPTAKFVFVVELFPPMEDKIPPTKAIKTPTIIIAIPVKINFSDIL